MLGAYAPRLVLLTTPSYAFNARFTAPDAPPGARGGFPDPTGRTRRVFRHADHKFEWTPSEFTRWCAQAAEAWGYDVELGGVGRAVEADPWGRDAELGWASQVAAFVRREGAAWTVRRRERWAAADAQWKDEEGGEAEEGAAHKLVAAHHHLAHEAAGRAALLADVGELLLAKMAEYRVTALSVPEAWREAERACGGRIEWLVCAVRAHAALALHRDEDGDGYRAAVGTDEEWVVRLDPAFHHLVPLEPLPDLWASPSSLESEEAGESWDQFSGDGAGWGTADGNVVVQEADTGAEGNVDGWASWGAVVETALEDGGWGAPEDGWGKNWETTDAVTGVSGASKT